MRTILIPVSHLYHRYESPIGASPSRNLDHQKPFYEDEMFDRSTSYRGSLGKSLGNAPSYNGKDQLEITTYTISRQGTLADSTFILR